MGSARPRHDQDAARQAGARSGEHELSLHFSIAESPRNAAVLWTGTDDGNVWVSRDTGRMWINTTGKFPKGAPTDCFVHRSRPRRMPMALRGWRSIVIIATTTGRTFWRTTDFGATWTELVNGLPADRGSMIVIESPRNARVLFAGTSDGVYVTLDGGQRWRRFGKDLPT